MNLQAMMKQAMDAQGGMPPPPPPTGMGPEGPTQGLQGKIKQALGAAGSPTPDDQGYGDIKTGSDLVAAVQKCQSLDECKQLLQQYGPIVGPTMNPQDIALVEQAVRQLSASQGSGDPNAQATQALKGGM